MAKSLSNDLRKRVVEAVESGLSRRAAADKFNVGISSAIHWVDRYHKTGSWEALKRGRIKARAIWKTTNQKFWRWWKVKRTSR